MTRLQKKSIHVPSHKHLLISFPKQVLDMCDACGKEHKGIFYYCPMCVRSKFIHSHCALLPQKLQIQHTTNDVFSHIHHLTLAYSFPDADQESKDWRRCREKPVSTTKLMNILDLLHLPFLDPSYSILRHLFFKEKGLTTLENSNKITYETHGIIHQHPLILEDITISTSTRLKSISYHDPMKRIELLCDGCLRPIMSGLIYVCANEEEEHCNFALHEWCSRLPTELKGHFHHPQHTLILHSKTPGKFFGVFNCHICALPCNGFVYYCEECKY
ncbi:hypothetical protein HanXRQr2_Chr16g0724701 [Helianthus annuus]|uniref:DC1 domain-containing protein n=1 Tax=Helianthus annuus TaxID=4232 RepID=A0A251RWZ9_HELAN|nr:hypothetical protein HanXRQr2_Chr16g0724701 [Helianthus annuus]